MSKLESVNVPVENLVQVGRPANPVVLGSGGPIMNLVSTEGDIGLCEWKSNGKLCRHPFPLVCLYECRDMGGYERPGTGSRAGE